MLLKKCIYTKYQPALLLAQGMLESGNGNSALCRNANNHFGIKCHKEWGGETYIMDDDSAKNVLENTIMY
jgi:flagellum-specific peptidoglycan hydrolase FlgJ